MHTNNDLPNRYSRSAAKTIMHPIGQNIPVIYPHFETTINIPGDFFAENHLSTEPEISWGSGNFGQHLPDVHQRRATPTHNSRRLTVLYKRSMEVFRGGWMSSSVIFARTQNIGGRISWPISVEFFRGNVATEIGHGIPSCKNSKTARWNPA